MSRQGLTTFYDSVCGAALFRAPQNRSLEAWQNETTEHGWPSFRIAELVPGSARGTRQLGTHNETAQRFRPREMPENALEHFTNSLILKHAEMFRLLLYTVHRA